MLDFNSIDPKAPLYYCVVMGPPDYKKRRVQRFLSKDAAIAYIKKKTGLEKGKNVRTKIIFSPSVRITSSVNLQWFTGLAQRTKGSEVDIGIKQGILNFFADKLFEIPGAPKSLIIELLAEPDAFTRDNMILAYKLKNPKQYPDLLD